MSNTESFEPKSILITGGSGFIGSNFIRFLLEKTGYDGIIVNYDLLTYAGNPENLKDIDSEYGNEQYFFIKGDICDREKLDEIFGKYNIDTVIHFAAESHVDRSILGPEEFIRTNITGTFTLLNTAKKHWLDNPQSPITHNPKPKTQNPKPVHRFHHISTDEVYGTLGDTGYFYETTPYDPRSPYSASKASSDHLARAYYHTYGLPVTISNCTNNYGPFQFPEKLIPLMILNMMEGKPLPIYGNGKNIRDWLFVVDHCDAIWEIIKKGRLGNTYNIGGENEWTNIDLVTKLCEIMDKEYPCKYNSHVKGNSYKELISFVKDRPGHDHRYAINCDKLKNELGWRQSVSFEEGLKKTVKWYLLNTKWIDNIKSGGYKKWVEQNYNKR